MQKITPFLWFDKQAEEAVNFYVATFKDSGIGTVTRYNEAAAAASGQPAGSVMTMAFKLNGQDFIALNGGPHFSFSEAVSFVVNCDSQQEIDHYWNTLSAGGPVEARQCGWLKDRYGLSWQIVPAVLPELLGKSPRVMQALLQMKKIDLAALQKAAA
ncbi:MAG: VOC family protein [Burkholderiales bacterium]|nr:VOC family protein [Burkholderiales bacterium]